MYKYTVKQPHRENYSEGKMKESIKHTSGFNHYKAITDKISVSICAGSNIEARLPFSLPANYNPDESEAYMNNKQLKYFKVKLHELKQNLTEVVIFFTVLF